MMNVFAEIKSFIVFFVFNYIFSWSWEIAHIFTLIFFVEAPRIELGSEIETKTDSTYLVDCSFLIPLQTTNKSQKNQFEKFNYLYSNKINNEFVKTTPIAQCTNTSRQTTAELLATQQVQNYLHLKLNLRLIYHNDLKRDEES